MLNRNKINEILGAYLSALGKGTIVTKFSMYSFAKNFQTSFLEKQ